MSQACQPLTQERIEAFAASIVVWLIALVRDLVAHPFQARLCLHRAVKRGERAVESVLFLMAARHAIPTARRNQTYLPRACPIGFRRRRKSSRLLFKHARVRLRGGDVLQRLSRLLAVLARPERYIARFSKLLRGGQLRGSRLIAVAPPARMLKPHAATQTAIADSS